MGTFGVKRASEKIYFCPSTSTVVGIRPEHWIRIFLGPARHLNLYSSTALKYLLALTLCLSHGLIDFEYHTQVKH